MTAGVKTLKTRGQEVTTFTRRLAPPGEYDFKLLSDRASIKVGQSAESLPRISAMVELLGTEGESGKNIKLFNDLYTSMKPGKDGIAMPYRGSGVVALARSFGEELEDANPPLVQVKGVEAISAKWLLQWAKNRHEQVGRCRVRIEQRKGPDGKPTGEKENRIELFIPGEPSAEAGGAEEVSEEVEELLENGGEVELEAEEAPAEEEQVLEEEVVEEELPPPPVKKAAPKPGPKVQQGPAKKPAGKPVAKKR